MTLNELIEMLLKLQADGYGESKVKIVCWSDEYKVEEPFVDENNEIVL
jgi:hypothetical protein